MIRRRPLTSRSDSSASTEATNAAEDLQRALRLGWAVAETFGRLRVYQPEFANKRNDPHELPRFSYSNSDLSGAQRLETSYRQLIELAAALRLPQPELPELAHFTAGTVPLLNIEQKKQTHSAIETWSRSAWVQLNVRSAALGRAMTYGGSLADTYWYMAQPNDPAFLNGRPSIEALLRTQRLQRMQERMDELKEAFSDELCDAISHTLDNWKWDNKKEAWSTAKDWSQLGVEIQGRASRTPQQQLHFNLFRQVRIWRDLLFASRQPIDYVQPSFRLRAKLLIGSLVGILALLVALSAGIGIFLAVSFILDFIMPNISTGGQNNFVEIVSIIITSFSTLSSGLLARTSEAVHQIDTWLESKFIGRAIRKATLVPWNDPPRKPGE